MLEQAGKLEQSGKIDELANLYEQERKKYRETSKKQDQLNIIALFLKVIKSKAFIYVFNVCGHATVWVWRSASRNQFFPSTVGSSY